MSAAWLVILPLLGGTLIFLLGRRVARALGPLTALLTLLLVLQLARQLESGPLRHALGGWAAPLGIELVSDTTSVFMLLLTALVGLAVSLYASAYFNHKDGPWLEADSFWPLWLFLWAAMNALYLSADFFNLYVTLELVTLASVALVILSGKEVSLTAGIRYLLAAMAGSLFFLFGVALVYAEFGTLALGGVAAAGTSSTSSVALVLMTLGLMVKTALWPFHFWLPPAHASAPAPVSAALSGLVVKAPFYLILRLWLEVFPAALPYAWLLGACGAVAILWGSWQAVRQARLKLLIAYSTVAQLGFLFLLFPLTQGAGDTAWQGGLTQALAHGLAKAAMFLVAGGLIHATGSDELKDIRGALPRLPLLVLAFALAGYSLLGLYPSGGYLGKEGLLEGAVGLWYYALRAGGLLSAVYLALALRAMLGPAPGGAFRKVPVVMQLTPLLLALLAALLGLLEPLSWLRESL